MKNKFLIIALNILLLSNTKLIAQRWSIGGNNLTADSRFGSNNAFDVLFETNNLERGRITDAGLWGIGTTVPNSKLHINSASGQDGFRVQINSSTKLLVSSNGGVALGSLTTPPANGLAVSGNTGIGLSLPAVKLQVAGGSDASPSGGGFIVSGLTNTNNVAIDDNEIMARDNGAASTLTLNNNGGNVVINGTNTDDANVGIGISSPVSDLHIVHEIGVNSNGLTIEDNVGSGLDWNIYSASTQELWLSRDGKHIGSFNGTSGAYTALSDQRFKKDIVSMENVLEKVMKLNPRLYHFNTQTQQNDRKYIGLIAQEVQPVFPEAVYDHIGKNDGSNDYLTLDYSTFGVIAIKAIQEQQQKIDTLEDRIAKLEAALSKVNSTSSGNSNAISNKEMSGVSLEQNQPNPFNQSATIRYTIPQTAKAQIVIYDASGQLVKTLQASQSGAIQINAYDLKAGVYTYSLVVNGKLTASKKMMITK